MLTAERLREILSYDPLTGLWEWLVRASNRCAKGRFSGSPGSDGYPRIRIDGKNYPTHRLAVLYMTGEWPEADVDHKDRNRTNGTWDNLRPCTRSQNLANKVVRTDSATGVKGVAPNPYSKKNPFRVIVGGKHIGCYPTTETASAAYIAAATESYGPFARS